MTDRPSYSAFVATRADELLRTAFLLSRDWGQAEDLLQEALTRAWFVWDRLGPDPEPYVRKRIVAAFLGWRRRLRWTDRSGRAATSDGGPEVETEPPDTSYDGLWRGLGVLPPWQRAVMVLRYHENLPVAEIADVLGCSPETVKRLAGKALMTLDIDDPLFPPVRAGTG